MTNLLELVYKTEEEIQWYLEDVSIQDFIRDVENLAKLNTNKKLIDNIIDQLEKLR